MREYYYKKIDAFTSGNSCGNPAACIYLTGEQKLSQQEMQEIARQHKGFVSEMVYCRQTTDEKFKLSYYSSECEVDFCGHGTIACMYSLIRQTEGLMAKKELMIDTVKKGKLVVYNRIVEQDAVYITAPQPFYQPSLISRDRIAEQLGISASDISKEYQLEVINAGLTTLIVPITKLDIEISTYPKEQELKKYCLEQGIDIILVFTVQVENKEKAAHTRVFAPKFGYLEDPATGSGNSAFGYYMLKHQMWKGEAISLEQGGNNIEYNEVKLMTHEGKVLFGGSATDRIIGSYLY